MNFASEEYNGCKAWIAEQIQNGATWDEVKNLFTERWKSESK